MWKLLPSNTIYSILCMILVHFNRIIRGISLLWLRFDNCVWNFTKLIFSHACCVNQIELQMLCQFTWPNSCASIRWWSWRRSNWFCFFSLLVSYQLLLIVKNINNLPIFPVTAALAATIVIIFTFDAWIQSSGIISSTLSITPLMIWIE